MTVEHVEDGNLPHALTMLEDAIHALCGPQTTWVDDRPVYVPSRYHFIVGHFGHVRDFDGGWINVKISHGPDGGKPDRRVFTDDDDEGRDGIWPMIADELEAVD